MSKIKLFLDRVKYINRNIEVSRHVKSLSKSIKIRCDLPEAVRKNYIFESDPVIKNMRKYAELIEILDERLPGWRK